ncbi:MAG: hypothetical protein N4A63_13170 [Vallitalea sp.]|nr:hypothetical protein [Vallitalea sp.]
MINKVELKDKKENVGNVDGTFGVSANIDYNNKIITWVLRHDEKIKQFTSKDFLRENTGLNRDEGSSGLISSDKNTVLSCEYKVNENNCQSKWEFKLNVYTNSDIQ